MDKELEKIINKLKELGYEELVKVILEDYKPNKPIPARLGRAGTCRVLQWKNTEDDETQ